MYVLEAVTSLGYIRREEYHNAERPIAQLTSLMFNMNRSKKTKSLTYLDFSFYKSSKNGALPDWIHGASMQAALAAELFPRWAYFVYKPLVESGGQASEAPPCFIAQCEDIVVLTPKEDNGVLTGLFIMKETASNRIRKLGANDGTIYTVKVPEIKTKIVAEENLVMELLSVSYLG